MSKKVISILILIMLSLTTVALKNVGAMPQTIFPPENTMYSITTKQFSEMTNFEKNLVKLIAEELNIRESYKGKMEIQAFRNGFEIKNFTFYLKNDSEQKIVRISRKQTNYDDGGIDSIQEWDEDANETIELRVTIKDSDMTILFEKQLTDGTVEKKFYSFGNDIPKP